MTFLLVLGKKPTRTQFLLPAYTPFWLDDFEGTHTQKLYDCKSMPIFKAILSRHFTLPENATVFSNQQIRREFKVIMIVHLNVTLDIYHIDYNLVKIND